LLAGFVVTVFITSYLVEKDEAGASAWKTYLNLPWWFDGLWVCCGLFFVFNTLLTYNFMRRSPLIGFGLLLAEVYAFVISAVLTMLLVLAQRGYTRRMKAQKDDPDICKKQERKAQEKT
jgi:hypothetical protein